MNVKKDSFAWNRALQEIQELVKESEANTEGTFNAFHNPKFDNSAVIFSITLHDNDFGLVLERFVDSLKCEISSESLQKLTTAQKEEYFTEVWNRSCTSLYYLTTVRSYHVAKWGEDLYEPKGYGPLKNTQKYLIDSVQIKFDDNAQAVFNEIGDWGNGEFVFVDAHGVVGFL